jgi:hypothetical protein
VPTVASVIASCLKKDHGKYSGVIQAGVACGDPVGARSLNEIRNILLSQSVKNRKDLT